MEYSCTTARILCLLLLLLQMVTAFGTQGLQSADKRVVYAGG
jgi:hypothetical protein